jgi:hypothetical protein
MKKKRKMAAREKRLMLVDFGIVNNNKNIMTSQFCNYNAHQIAAIVHIQLWMSW